MKAEVLDAPGMRRVAKVLGKGARAAAGGHFGAMLSRWQAVDCLWEAALRSWGQPRVLFGIS